MKPDEPTVAAIVAWLRRDVAAEATRMMLVASLPGGTRTVMTKRRAFAEGCSHGVKAVIDAIERGEPSGVSEMDDSKPLRTTDPMERLIEQALIDAGIEYVTDFGGENPSGLDFKLTDYGVEIEVKQYHSERTGRQMKRAPNVIVAQGRPAVEFLARLLRESAPAGLLIP